MNLLTAEVVSNTEIMPRTHDIRLRAPKLAGAQPGQFVHIRCSPRWDPLLRRPMSVFRIHEDGVSLMVRAVGGGSEMIASAQPGQLFDVLGPLGKPFTIYPRPRRLVMIAGGYGVAPLLALASKVLPTGAEVVLLVGASTAAHAFPASDVPPEIEYETATVDGTHGHLGLVTDLLRRYLDWGEAYYACGPTPMLEAVANIVRPAAGLAWHKPVQLAMEQHMGCAMGVCLGCVVRTRRGYERVCRDGPVFEARDLVWESLS